MLKKLLSCKFNFKIFQYFRCRFLIFQIKLNGNPMTYPSSGGSAPFFETALSWYGYLVFNNSRLFKVYSLSVSQCNRKNSRKGFPPLPSPAFTALLCSLVLLRSFTSVKRTVVNSLTVKISCH